MAEIVWTEVALDDLSSIYNYIAKESVFYAEKFTDKLADRADILIDHPEAGRVVPEFEDASIRELIEGSYRIIYNIESTDVIGILRIHHSSQPLIFPL